MKNIQLASVSLFIALWPFLYRAALGTGSGEAEYIDDQPHSSNMLYGAYVRSTVPAIANCAAKIASCATAPSS